MKHHPDRRQSSPEASEETFKEVTYAYKVRRVASCQLEKRMAGGFTHAWVRPLCLEANWGAWLFVLVLSTQCTQRHAYKHDCLSMACMAVEVMSTQILTASIIPLAYKILHAQPHVFLTHTADTWHTSRLICDENICMHAIRDKAL